MLEMRSVYSGSVHEVGHDADANELHVVWKDGKRSVYSGVDAGMADQIANAPSVGQAIHQMLKKADVPHRYG